jgi:hypothetical protein
MKNQALHTTNTTAGSLRLLPEIGLVDLDDPSLSGRLAGKVSDQLEAFATPMRQGRLAASVAIGLDVMGELVEAADVAGQKGKHDPDRTTTRHGTARHRGRQGHPWRAAHPGAPASGAHRRGRHRRRARHAPGVL